MSATDAPPYDRDALVKQTGEMVATMARMLVASLSETDLAWVQGMTGAGGEPSVMFRWQPGVLQAWLGLTMPDEAPITLVTMRFPSDAHALIVADRVEPPAA